MSEEWACAICGGPDCWTLECLHEDAGEGDEMKTDRELLELAAKAAGYVGFIDDVGDGAVFVVTGLNPFYFRPLTDDGDAFRLAVDLRFDVENNGHFASVVCADLEHPVMCECNDGDKYATTRRAIVRAAAAIGESMK